MSPMRFVSKYLGILGPAALLLGTGLPAWGMPFFDFHGFSYLNGPPNMIGTTVTVPTLFNLIQPDPIWPVNFDNEEYTVLVTDLRISRVEQLGSITNVTYEGGTIALYRDPTRNANWLVHPPNGSVPSSFKDGEALLVGRFTDLVMVFNSRSGSGTISGQLDWTGGTRLSQMPSRTGWTYFGGVSSHANLGIPAGYDLAWDPQIYGPDMPNQVRSMTWGGVKDLYHQQGRTTKSGRPSVGPTP
jgi:hypothetical protein